MPAEIVVLCPLEIERRAASAAVAARARVVRTGPGALAVARAVEGLDLASNGLVVLFGVAGGIAESPIAVTASDVIDGDTGERWTPTVGSDGGVVVVGVEAPIGTVEEKRALAARTGASVVDCESHGFARACAERGVRWAIVRGVSDGPGDTLPACAATWVRDDGITNARRVAADLLRRPVLIAPVARLGRATRAGLASAGARLDRIIDEESRRIGAS